MSFYANLHKLPRGKHMYTVLVKCEDEYDEYDIVLRANAHVSALLADTYADSNFTDLYPDPCKIVGIIDQSTGEKLWEAV